MDTKSLPEACCKCGGAMFRGFVIDHSHTARVVSSWAAGVPEISFWTGLKKLPQAPISIGVFRCAVCGYLESYARDEFAPE